MCDRWQSGAVADLGSEVLVLRVVIAGALAAAAAVAHGLLVRVRPGRRGAAAPIKVGRVEYHRDGAIAVLFAIFVPRILKGVFALGVLPGGGAVRIAIRPDVVNRLADANVMMC